MAKSGILQENEKVANKIAAKVMRVTFLIFTVVYLLNVINVFVIEDKLMTIVYIVGSILLLMPTVYANWLKWDGCFTKYYIVVSSVFFVTLLCITLSYHVVVIYVYPIAIASLYFSKKLNVLATGLTVVGVSVGQLIAPYMDAVTDDNFGTMERAIIFGIIPRGLILIAIAAIFTMLTSRTAALLSNLMGAEEQEKILTRMQQMQESASATSEKLFDMVGELSDIADNSLKSNQEIAEEAEKLLRSSIENTAAVQSADNRMQDISEQLVDLSDMNHRTAALTEQIGENTRDNQQRMDETTISMEQIYDSTNECKKIIATLGEQSQEIIGIVETITGISSKTNILALNASIEASRAGEHGKGFAVVAQEIRNLAEQTRNAVENIGVIVQEVVGNTETAVTAMEQSVLYTQSGKENIEKANISTAMITSSNAELVEQIHAIDRAAEIIREKSSEVAEAMRQISNNTEQNSNAIEHVTAATQESTAGTEDLAELVVQVKGLSEELNRVVHG